MYKIIMHFVFNFSTKRPHNQRINPYLSEKVAKIDKDSHFDSVKFIPEKINNFNVLIPEETQPDIHILNQIEPIGTIDFCRNIETHAPKQNSDNLTEHIGKEEYCEFLEYILKHKDDTQEMEKFQRQVDEYTKEKTFNIFESILAPQSSTTEILPLNHDSKVQTSGILIESDEVNNNKSILYLNYPFFTTESSINNDLFIDTRNQSLIISGANFLHGKVDVFTDTFEVSEFFECYLSNITPTDLRKIIKHFERKTIETSFSVFNIQDKIIEQFKKNNSFVEFSYNLIKTLERKFFIRLFFIYKFVMAEKRMYLDPTIDFVMNDKSEKKFTSFYHNYICSSYVHNFFKQNFNINFEVDSLGEHVNQIKEMFNTFLGKYAKQVKEIFSNKFEKYNKIVKEAFLFNDLEIQKAYLQVWLTNLINNKTNSLLIILFPELKFILNRIKQIENLRLFYKRTHFFFSLLIFKLNYNLPRIKYEFEKISLNSPFLITEAKFINLFLLEIRCLICFYGLFIFADVRIMKLFFIKAFISYTRSLNPTLCEYFLFNEYTIFEDLNHSFDQISINFLPSKNFYLSENGEFNNEKELHILHISDELISEEIYKLSEDDKFKLINQNKMNDDQETNTFELKNQDIIKKVTIVLEEYFKSFKK